MSYRWVNAESCNPITNALKLRISCTNPSIWSLVSQCDLIAWLFGFLRNCVRTCRFIPYIVAFEVNSNAMFPFHIYFRKYVWKLDVNKVSLFLWNGKSVDPIKYVCSDVIIFPLSNVWFPAYVLRGKGSFFNGMEQVCGFIHQLRLCTGTEQVETDPFNHLTHWGRDKICRRHFEINFLVWKLCSDSSVPRVQLIIS